jgi:hypothetical protein
MPNKLVRMTKIRQILRCYAQGKGTKAISSMLSVSRKFIIVAKVGVDFK